MTTATKEKELTQNLSIFTIEIAYAAVKMQRMFADKNKLWNEGDAECTAFVKAEQDLQHAFIKAKKDMEDIRRGGPKMKDDQ